MKIIKYLLIGCSDYKGGEISAVYCYDTVEEIVNSLDSVYTALHELEDSIEDLSDTQLKEVVVEVVEEEFEEIYGDANHVYRLHVDTNKTEEVYQSELISSIDWDEIVDYWRNHFADPL